MSSEVFVIVNILDTITSLFFSLPLFQSISSFLPLSSTLEYSIYSSKKKNKTYSNFVT